MRAIVMYEAGDIRVEDVPDPSIIEPTDALIRVTRACICGSDLHPYHQLERTETGVRMSHEAIGVVEDLGSEVAELRKGDVVVMPFAYSDGACASGGFQVGRQRRHKRDRAHRIRLGRLLVCARHRPLDADPAIAYIAPSQPTGLAGSYAGVLEEGLRLVKPMNLMALGDYQEPPGGWFPSVLY